MKNGILKSKTNDNSSVFGKSKIVYFIVLKLVKSMGIKGCIKLSISIFCWSKDCTL